MGRDVESMIRDLVEVAVKLVEEEAFERVQARARELAEERVLDLLLPPARKKAGFEEKGPEAGDTTSTTRDKIRTLLRDGKMDEREVSVETTETRMPMMEIFSSSGLEEMGINMKDAFGHMFPKKTKQRRVKVSDAMALLTREEANKLRDRDKVVEEALLRAQNNGIIFLDEIDKIAGARVEAWPRCKSRRRPARPASHRRGLDRHDQARHGQNRPRAVHRRRRFSYRQRR